MGSRAWSPTLKMVSTRAAPSSQPSSTSFAPTTQRQPNRRPPVFPTGTPAQSSSASPPDGNASPTVKRQRYSASTRPQGKRNQPRDRGFDSGRSFVAARLNQLRPRPPNASLPVIRQPSRRERQPNRQTPALQRKRTTSRQAQPPLESATPPVISALTRSIPWKTAIKIEGLSAFRTFP